MHKTKYVEAVRKSSEFFNKNNIRAWIVATIDRNSKDDKFICKANGTTDDYINLISYIILELCSFENAPPLDVLFIIIESMTRSILEKEGRSVIDDTQNNTSGS